VIFIYKMHSVNSFLIEEDDDDAFMDC